MTLETAPGTRALLALEDAAPAVLFERLPGTTHALWPQVRSDFMIAMQNVDFGSADVDAPEPSRASAWWGIARAMLPARTDARGLRGPRPIVHLAGGRTVHRVEGRERNWLFGAYLEAAPESSALLHWTPASALPPAFRPTRSLAPIVTRAAAYARLDRGRRAPVFEPIDRLVREFARLLELPVGGDRLAEIAADAAYREASRPHVESQMLRVIDRLAPRVALIEDASYGAWSSLIVRLKERGILVAEPQHGWIGPSHGAYNLGAAMATPELRRGLPDELLTFGDYWSSGIRVPYATTAVSKPHLEVVGAVQAPLPERPAEVLVVSSVVDPGATSDFVRALGDALPTSWRVRFRPHPSERMALAERYPRLLAHDRVEIDANPDVYDSLGSARGVVGVASTVLFEALALGCPVFALESAYADYYIGDLFGARFAGAGDAGRIAEALVAGAEPPRREILAAIWKPDATRNVQDWIDARLV